MPKSHVLQDDEPPSEGDDPLADPTIRHLLAVLARAIACLAGRSIARTAPRPLGLPQADGAATPGASGTHH